MGIPHLYTLRVENLGQSLKMQGFKLQILFLQTLSKSFLPAVELNQITMSFGLFLIIIIVMLFPIELNTLQY